jgi:hypothetical protein
MGYNFRPDWDKSLRQPWFGRWWVWLGPYVIGWPRDFEHRMRPTGRVVSRNRLALVFYRELGEHGYEDDDDKRMQIAYHFADVVLDKFESLGKFGRRSA